MDESRFSLRFLNLQVCIKKGGRCAAGASAGGAGCQGLIWLVKQIGVPVLAGQATRQHVDAIGVGMRGHAHLVGQALAGDGGRQRQHHAGVGLRTG